MRNTRYTRRNFSDLIDNFTGKVVSSYVDEKPVYDKYERFDYGNRYSFSKIFHKTPDPFDKANYNGYVFSIIKNLEQNTNIILSKRGRHVEIATADDIAKLLKLSIRTVRPFLTEAKKKLVIVSVRIDSNTGYVLNPAYSMNGLKIDPMSFLLFKDSIDFIRMLDTGQIETLDKLITDMDVKNYVKTKLGESK